jgi:hypothetical protein
MLMFDIGNLVRSFPEQIERAFDKHIELLVRRDLPALGGFEGFKERPTRPAGAPRPMRIGGEAF